MRSIILEWLGFKNSYIFDITYYLAVLRVWAKNLQQLGQTLFVWLEDSHAILISTYYNLKWLYLKKYWTCMWNHVLITFIRGFILQMGIPTDFDMNLFPFISYVVRTTWSNYIIEISDDDFKKVYPIFIFYGMYKYNLRFL